MRKLLFTAALLTAATVLGTGLVYGQSATIKGTSVTIAADASDNVGVVSVLFDLDGTTIREFLYTGTVPEGESPVNPSFVWNSTSVANGTYLLTATATDLAGNVGTSSVPVIVDNDNTPPSILITLPLPD